MTYICFLLIGTLFRLQAGGRCIYKIFTKNYGTNILAAFIFLSTLSYIHIHCISHIFEHIFNHVIIHVFIFISVYTLKHLFIIFLSFFVKAFVNVVKIKYMYWNHLFIA